MPFEDNLKKKCPDCLQCQMCGETRCRVCRKYGHGNGISELGSGFTHREYLAWKKRRRRNAVKTPPVVDIRECSDCGTCIELCPSVFVRNKETGLMEVRDLKEYPHQEIQEVMSYCPQDCIMLLEDA